MDQDGLLLKLTCPDQRGIVSRISSYIAEQDGNLVELSQFTDEGSGRFFARLEIDVSSLKIPADQFEDGFSKIGEALEAEWRFRALPYRLKTAVLTTTTDHCLNEILWRTKMGELPLEITSVIGNRKSCQKMSEDAGLSFHLVDLKGDREAKDKGFREIAALLEEQEVELVVLARFMQILPDWFCKKFEGRAINIHHSFLPAFIGARPYDQAYERGVKLIGATCHYVTSELDAGPIIEQEVERVHHHHGPADLVRLGRDCERRALARGIRYHVLERTILDGNRAIVFQD